MSGHHVIGSNIIGRKPTKGARLQFHGSGIHHYQNAWMLPAHHGDKVLGHLATIKNLPVGGRFVFQKLCQIRPDGIITAKHRTYCENHLFTHERRSLPIM